MLIREGSVSKDMVALAPLLTPTTRGPNMCLCTDDRNPLEHCRAWPSGPHDPQPDRHGLLTHWRSIPRQATLSAAEAFGLKDRGQIAPGKRADIVALPDLADCRASLVICGGQVVEGCGFCRAGKVSRPFGCARLGARAESSALCIFRHAGNAPDTPSHRYS